MLKLILTGMMLLVLGVPAWGHFGNVKEAEQWAQTRGRDLATKPLRSLDSVIAPKPDEKGERLLDEMRMKLRQRASAGLSPEEIERLQLPLPGMIECQVYWNQAKNVVERDPDQALRWLERHQKCVTRVWRDALRQQRELEEGGHNQDHPSALLVFGGVSCIALVGIFVIQLLRLRQERKKL